MLTRGYVVGVAVSVLSVALAGCVPQNPSKHNSYLKQQNIENYQAFSNIEIMGSNISNTLKVNGDLKAQNAVFNHVNVNGDTTIDNTIISGNFNANGFTRLNKVSVLDAYVNHGDLVLKNTWIKKPFAVYGKKLHIYNSWVQDIYIKSSKFETIVEVHGGSQVKGNITFESGRGRVFVDQHSKVHGSIVGGKSENEIIEVNLG